MTRRRKYKKIEPNKSAKDGKGFVPEKKVQAFPWPVFFVLVFALVWQSADLSKRFDDKAEAWAIFVSSSASLMNNLGFGNLGGAPREILASARERAHMELTVSAQGVSNGIGHSSPDLNVAMTYPEVSSRTPLDHPKQQNVNSTQPSPSTADVKNDVDVKKADAKQNQTQKSAIASTEIQNETQSDTPTENNKEVQKKLIIVAGDSMANGYASQFARISKKMDWVTIDAGRHSTGLTKKDYYDWPGHILDLARQRKPDAIVIAIGANDHQDMRINGKSLRFGTTEWIEAYRERAVLLVANARSEGAKVNIVGLPPMRDIEYERRIRLVEGVLRDVARASNVAFVEQPAVFGYCCTKFDPRGEGKRKLRADDGIHMTMEGYSIVAETVMSKL